MAEGCRDWLRAWEDFSAEGEEYRELDGERVLVCGRMRGRGKTSGVNVETEFANLLHLRNRKVSAAVSLPRPRARPRRDRVGGVGDAAMHRWGETAGSRSSWPRGLTRIERPAALWRMA